MRIQCSYCGQTQEFRGTVAAIRQPVAAGWRGFGSILYCPTCSATWPERNGTRSMAGITHTLEIIKTCR